MIHNTTALLNNLVSIHANDIITAYRGSIAHGLYIPPDEPFGSDDIDLISVCIPSIDHYFGLKTFGSRGTKESFDGDNDIVIYELLKALSLLKKGNPNILSLLWLDKDFYIKVSSVGQILLDNREIFVGKHIYHSFIGYAKSQLHRMTTKTDYSNCFAGNKRQQLRKQFGYDTKHASHLIRLLIMAIEFLRDGELHVNREGIDRDFLLDIKQGKFTLKEITREAEKLFMVAESMYQISRLPEKVDNQAVNDLGVKMLSEYFEYPFKRRFQNES